MKKALLLLVFLLLLALPLFALGETWSEFVDLAEDALKDAQAGEVVSLRAPNLVTARAEGTPDWEKHDAPEEVYDRRLNVPDGVRLEIKGGAFEIIVPGRGDITLTGTTVTGLPDIDAILILPTGKEGLLHLTIGEGSTVTASGSGRAISATYWHLPGSLKIVNQGVIAGDGAACADLRMTPESGNAALGFTNHGEIRGNSNGVMLLAEPAKGAASIRMENTGTLYVAGDTAVGLTVRNDKRGAFATLENSGTISQGGPEGAAVVMEVTDTAAGSANGQGIIANRGVIRATAEPIRLRARGDTPVPVRIEKGGVLEETSGRIAPAAYVYVENAEDARLKADTLEALGQQWAQALNLGAMPTGTRMELVVVDAQGGEQDRLTVRGEGTPVRDVMTWKEFRAWAQEQLDLAPAGELRLYVNAEVGPPKGMDSGRDKGLNIPGGKKLTLVGGSYEQILLANGALELTGVEAKSLSIPAGEDAVDITLILGEDTAFAAAGAGNWAIYTEGKLKKASTITLQNHGRIESEDGGIDLAAAVVGDREVRFDIQNTGKILTRGQAVRLTATTQSGQAFLTLTNDGVVESTGANAAELIGLSSKNQCQFLVTNGAEANLHCSTGNALTIRTLDPTAKAVNPRERVPELEEPWGLVTVDNRGKIGGRSAPIQVESLLRALFPVEIQNQGTITVKEGDAELLYTALYHAEKEDRIVKEEEFDEVVGAHIGAAFRLPEGIRVRMRVRVPATEKITEDLFLYEKGVE